MAVIISISKLSLSSFPQNCPYYSRGGGGQRGGEGHYASPEKIWLGGGLPEGGRPDLAEGRARRGRGMAHGGEHTL